MKKTYFLLMLTILIIIFIPKNTLADFGPKSSLSIYVKNAPQEQYYLDLLVNYEHMDAEYDSKKCKEELYDMLWNYDENGYRATMIHQDSSIRGLRGSLEGKDKGDMLHDFVQVPSEFKIIIVSSKGGIRVSDIYRKVKFSDEIYLNYETMEITPAGDSVIGNWVLQFLKTFSVTLLIEGIILLLFGFKLKPNWKPVILVNLCTQIFLIISTGLIMLFRGAFAFIFWFGLIEVAIIIIESIVYKKLLHRQKRDGRVAYAITANVISMLFTFIYLLNTSLY